MDWTDIFLSFLILRPTTSKKEYRDSFAVFLIQLPVDPRLPSR